MIEAEPIQGSVTPSCLSWRAKIAMSLSKVKYEPMMSAPEDLIASTTGVKSWLWLG